MTHTPVLLNEVITILDLKPGEKIIDATAGEGGHLRELLKHKASVLAIDQDKNQIKNLKKQLKENMNLKFAVGNFAEIEKIARKADFFPVEGIIFDLGLSYEQIQNSGKGFTYRNLNEDLDMRMNEKTTISAKDILNSSSEEELYQIFVEGSEDLNSRMIANQIVNVRRKKEISTVGDLIRIIDEVTKEKDPKTYARIFQALRIRVNDEYENLKKGLSGGLKILKTGGKMAVITFHSLEDRVVKKYIRENKLATTDKNVIKNPSYKFARSAKLRVIIKN